MYCNSYAMFLSLSVNSTFLLWQSTTTHFAKITSGSVFKIHLMGSITAFSGHSRHSSLQHFLGEQTNWEINVSGLVGIDFAMSLFSSCMARLMPINNSSSFSHFSQGQSSSAVSLTLKMCFSASAVDLKKKLLISSLPSSQSAFYSSTSSLNVHNK